MANLKFYYKSTSVFLYLLLSLGFAQSSMASTINSNTVLVTGTIVDNSKFPWVSRDYGTSFYLRFNDDKPIQVNIPPHEIPSRGQFIIPVEVGKNYKVMLGFLSFDSICTFDVEATSQTHATMKLVSTDNNEYVSCSYSGDPNSDTATIIITNNTMK